MIDPNSDPTGDRHTIGLNDQQRAAAQFDGQHCLILAGAGTGKTTTIVARVAHLIEQGVDPKRILLLTFTRRAAREMKQRMGRLAGSAGKDVSAGTFHRFCLTFMRRWPKFFGTTGATIIDRDDQVSLMKLARATKPQYDKLLPKAPLLVNYYSYARNTNQGMADYLQTFTDLDEPAIQAAIEVVGVYGERKRECRYLDYDDILHVFAQTLHRDAKCRDKLAAMYDHILVDEMQDTNPLQWLILDAIRNPAKLFCVGDDAQSIYAFRGADFQNVHSFTTRVQDSQVLKLETNYRSYQPILDLSNWLLKTSKLDYDKHLVSSRGAGSSPQLIDFDSEFDEADWIAEDLRQRNQDGAAYRDHMILTRTAFGCRTVEAALIENDIPYRFIGGTTLLKSAHVKDLLALLRAIDNRDDQLAWMRFLCLWPRIGEKTAAKVIPQLQLASDTAEASQLLAKYFSDKPRLAGTVAAVGKKWKTATGAVAAAVQAMEELLEEKYDRWDSRKKDLELLIRLAATHQDVSSFIETYTLDPVTESEAFHDDNDDVLTLITVHSAKGTECPVCYVIGLQPGNYPHSRSVGKASEEEEERRVLYVAMTRAMNELIMTRTMRSGGAFVPHWSRYQAEPSGGSSYLLTGVPDDLLHNDIQLPQDDFDGPIVPRF